MDPIPEIMTFRLEKERCQAIDQIIAENVTDPIGPEFMGSPDRSADHYRGDYPLP